MNSDNELIAGATPLPVGADLNAALRAVAPADGERALISVRNVAFVDTRLALLHGTWSEDGVPVTRRALFAAAKDAGLAITELHRVHQQPAPSDSPLAGLVRDLVLLDPDAMARTFVVRLEPATDATRAIADELDRTSSADEAAAAQQIRTLVEAHQREQAQLLASRQELIAVQNGRLMRWSQFPRRVYRRLRGLLRRG